MKSDICLLTSSPHSVDFQSERFESPHVFSFEMFSNMKYLRLGITEIGFSFEAIEQHDIEIVDLGSNFFVVDSPDVPSLYSTDLHLPRSIISCDPQIFRRSFMVKSVFELGLSSEDNMR